MSIPKTPSMEQLPFFASASKESGYQAPRGSLRSRGPKFGLRLIVAALVSVFLLTSMALWSSPYSLKEANQKVSLDEFIYNARQSRLRRGNVKSVMIAKTINHSFCQSLFSMLANGYPAPILMHFDEEYHGWADKLESFDQYLQQMNAANDDTLFLLDGYDLVFQLPVEVALTRYGAAQKDLFFGADKRCWPVRNEEPPCTRMPQSLLATDIYGDKTDNDPWERPRWLNAGAVIGSSSTLRKIMHEAWKRAQEQTARGQEVNDQGILSDILTEDNADYSYTTDSISTIFQTMVISEVDVVWDVNPDPKMPSTVLSSKTSSQRMMNLTDLQLDTDMARQTSFWRDRWLARNIRSNEIPVALHFNGPDQKPLMDTWWTFNWFAKPDTYPALLKALQEESQPGGAGVYIKGKWLPFDEVCRSYPLF
jgi:hypothetical protein